MSSDYYGSIAGEMADEGEGAERAWLEWLNEYARREPANELADDLRAAFDAGRQSAQAAPLATEDSVASAGYCPLPEHCGYPCRC
jgi:hypothetical protein